MRERKEKLERGRNFHIEVIMGSQGVLRGPVEIGDDRNQKHGGLGVKESLGLDEDFLHNRAKEIELRFLQLLLERLFIQNTDAELS